MTTSSLRSRGERKMDNENAAIPAKRIEVPVWEKSTLTLDEAAAYSGIGKNKL